MVCASILTATAATHPGPANAHPAAQRRAALFAGGTDERDEADLRRLTRASRATARAAATPPAAAPPAPPPAPVAPSSAARHRPGAQHSTLSQRRAGRAAPTGNAAAAIAFALAQVGDAYRMGASGPGVWDCSGLVAAAYARIGIRLPHNAAAMLNYGRPVSRDQLAPGDLVITEGGGHVAIYIGHGWIVEAANPRVGVVARPMWGFDAGRRLV